jgi:hypothetical protein
MRGEAQTSSCSDPFAVEILASVLAGVCGLCHRDLPITGRKARNDRHRHARKLPLIHGNQPAASQVISEVAAQGKALVGGHLSHLLEEV